MIIRLVCSWVQWNRWGRKFGWWVVGYGPKTWAGAYFRKQEDAWRYAENLEVVINVSADLR